MWLADTGCRCTRLASSSIHSTSSMPRATVFFVPPTSWMLKVCSRGPSSSPSCAIIPSIWFASQPRPTMIKAPKLACRA